VPKPPKATHHSDIEGVHQDERRNVDVAIDAGQNADDVAEAKRQSRGRPPQSDASNDGT
jgi:hypothetical protein